ncbi:MAG: class I SAM-dependent methyltransferase [Phycisphaerales bacterium]|nr:class I SAM-dependent methyltransferase [Phycisphaerales bacterium]MCI0674708.1 class I SAM-dependent methyltransferase [Phycisphaerales bacterium]
MTKLAPFYKQVQAHYDLSNEFFALFLDPSMTYSCAYFQRNDMTLHQAQLAKIDLSLGKCDLPKAGQTSGAKRLRLLDVGCGWGSVARRAAQLHHVDVIGLTLSRNQHRYATDSLRDLPADSGHIDFRLQGWEEFEEPVDRIVSIGAFEHFRIERHAAFFDRCRSILPPGGRMLLHSIVMAYPQTLRRHGSELEHEYVLFAKFIRDYIFPGGQLCIPDRIIAAAQNAGFHVAQTQSLQPHYARTLDCWAANLRAARDQAIALTSQEVFDRYMHYLTGCARLFRAGHVDVMQFTLCTS